RRRTLRIPVPMHPLPLPGERTASVYALQLPPGPAFGLRPRPPGRTGTVLRPARRGIPSRPPPAPLLPDPGQRIAVLFAGRRVPRACFFRRIAIPETLRSEERRVGKA